MTRTFNRQPLSVNTPNKDDTKDYFFNHYNWKGLNDDKNFLDIDQETFNDCNNVYVDKEGLLRSRPSLKYVNLYYNNFIRQLWKFGTIEVYELDDTTLIFKDTISGTTVHKTYKNYSDNKLVMSDKKIFIFRSDGIDYYDVNEKKVLSATDYIYIPIKKTYVNNILSTEKTETDNALTTKNKTRYIYNGINYDFNTFINKTVDLKIGDDKHNNYNFKNNSQLTFVDNLNTIISEEYFDGKPLVQVADNGVIIKSIVKGNNVNNTCLIQYSVDGIIFNSLPIVTNIKTFPHITNDGYYVVVGTQYELLIHSLLKTDEGNYKYPSWTNLLQKQNNYSSWYNGLPQWVKDNGIFYYHSLDQQMSFLSDDTFSFICKVGGFPSYLLVSCIEGQLQDNRYITDSGNMANEIYSYMLNTTSSTGDTYKTYGNGNFETTIPDITCYLNNNDYTKNTATVKLTSVHYYDKLPGASSTNAQSKLEIKTIIKVGSKQFTVTASGNSDFSLIPDSSEYIGNVDKKYFYYDLIGSVTEGTIRFKVRAEWNENQIQFYISDIAFEYYTTSNIDYYHSGLKDNNIITNDNIIHYTAEYNSNKTLKVLMTQEGTINGTNYNISVLFDANTYYNTNSPKQIKSLVSYYITKTTSEKTTDYCKLAVNVTRDNRNDGLNYINGNVYWSTVENTNLYVRTYYYGEVSGKRTLIENNSLIQSNIDNNLITVFGYDSNYLLTNNYLFVNSSYLEDGAYKYSPIPLLHQNVTPLNFWYSGNTVNSMYYIYNNELYSNTAAKNIVIEVLNDGTITSIVPDYEAELSNYYFAQGKSLYISQPKYNDDKEFIWYFPEIYKQSFDYEITNLHTISTTEVAIFLQDSIYYVTYDNDVNTYKYFKTKAQVGCLKGSDVITTFDSKYTIFTSSRGIVAMSYQEFIASTEQSLTYITDSIYSVFEEYRGTRTDIKLYKYSYWIIVYAYDDFKGFVFDIRNNSWWPFEVSNKVTEKRHPNGIRQIITLDKPFVVFNSCAYNFDNSDTNYYDEYYSTAGGPTHVKQTINWFIKSQKLYLNAINYYKHIVNITFMSSHDLNVLNNNDYNLSELDFKLQVNSYRKKVDGNIGSEQNYSSVNYNVETVRTFVQRLNYPKVNEFEYMLSYDNQTAINIPLSLSGITIKYKIGGQVR